MLADNLSTDDAKLEYVSRIPNGRRLVLGLMEEDRQVLVNKEKVACPRVNTWPMPWTGG